MLLTIYDFISFIRSSVICFIQSAGLHRDHGSGKERNCLYRTKLKLNGEYNIRIRRECPDDQNNEIRKNFFLNLLCITYHFLFLKKKHTKLLLLLNHLQSTYCQWYNNMSWWGFNWVHSDDLADLTWNRGVLKICKQMGVQIEDDS